jgi:hypothetical protein
MMTNFQNLENSMGVLSSVDRMNTFNWNEEGIRSTRPGGDRKTMKEELKVD